MNACVSRSGVYAHACMRACAGHMGERVPDMGRYIHLTWVDTSMGECIPDMGRYIHLQGHGFHQPKDIQHNEQVSYAR